MRTDRYTKIVLTVIAVALCVIALPRLETAKAMAASRQPATASADDIPEGASPLVEQPAPPRAPVGPTSTLPLRWRVSWASLNTGELETFCSTAVVVTNTTNSATEVEVEWMNHTGTSTALQLETVLAYRTFVWVLRGATATINPVPWRIDNSATISSGFKGHALVNSDDPRIMVSAYQYCRTDKDSPGPTVLAHTNIPAYPVGATAEYFQAGMPMNWTPPIVEPEVPE
jgi:hypothetical protein